jgi:hypothetical protein
MANCSAQSLCLAGSTIPIHQKLAVRATSSLLALLFFWSDYRACLGRRHRLRQRCMPVPVCLAALLPIPFATTTVKTIAAKARKVLRGPLPVFALLGLEANDSTGYVHGLEPRDGSGAVWRGIMLVSVLTPVPCLVCLVDRRDRVSLSLLSHI